jgi:AbrB family looped-hinge helix DNA binding protein
VAVFTSSEEELKEADTSLGKSAEFTQVSFSGTIDTKGRITIPARIRNKLDLESGDRISVSLDSSEVIRKEFSSEPEALEFLSELENVQCFSFDGETLEVVLNE